MERIAYSYLAGAATITAAVVLSGAHAAIFFGLGFAAAVALAVLIVRLAGARRIAQLLAPEVANTRQRAARAEAALGSARPTRRAARPVTDENLFARYQRMPKREKMRVEMDAWNEAFEKDLAEPAAIAPAVEEILKADNVADDVVSALQNLKVPARRAHEAVNQAQKTAGPDFDSLFQTALSIARKVA
jgi:hypothetical protein